MKKIIRSKTVTINGHTLPINCNPDKGEGSYLEILERTYEQLTAMLYFHSQTTVIISQLHTRAFSDKNTLISQFFKELKRALGRKYNRMHLIGFVWGRELESAQSQHYHIGLMLNASAVKMPSSVIQLIESIWQKLGQPKPYTPKHCFYIVKRNDLSSYNDPFYRLSYIAKARGKGHRAKTANDFSCSRLKPITPPLDEYDTEEQPHSKLPQRAAAT